MGFHQNVQRQSRPALVAPCLDELHTCRIPDMTLIERLLRGPLGCSGAKYILIHFCLMCAEVRVWLLHLYGTRVTSRRYRGQTGLKLNVGCGPNSRSGWVNLDLMPTADVRLDLRKRLPFESSSCSIVYSEHFFEHLEYPGEVRCHLEECRRVLESGGQLHLGVPNAGGVMRQYSHLHNTGELTEPFERHWAHPNWVVTRVDAINFLFRQNYSPWDHQHKWAYDFLLLEKLLGDAGFVHIFQRDFMPDLDAANRQGSLYVVGEKP